jgi:hypothetical protein
MKWTVRIVCILAMGALCAIACAAYAAEGDHKWEQYSKDKQGLTFYYDKTSITYPSAGVIKVWRKRSFPVRASQKELISLDEIDCLKQKYRSVQMQVVQWDDTAETFNKVAEWSVIYGDSPEEILLDTACMEVRKKK